MSFHNNAKTQRHLEFEATLKANPFDTYTREVYADCLEEDGEYEEADRQRRWSDAFYWIFATIHGCYWYGKDDDNGIQTEQDGLAFIEDFVNRELASDYPHTRGFNQPDEWQDRNKLNSCLEIVTGHRLSEEQRQTDIGCSC